MKPRFKNKDIERAYRACLEAFSDPVSFLYWKGKPRRGSSGRCNFWNGYFDQGRRPERGTIGYGYYVAGELCRSRHIKSPHGDLS